MMQKVCVVLCGIVGTAVAIEQGPERFGGRRAPEFGPRREEAQFGRTPERHEERRAVGTPEFSRSAAERSSRGWESNAAEREEVMRSAQARHTNWYIKNKVYKEAQGAYEALRDKAALVPELKAGLLEKRGESDDLVKSFLQEIEYDETRVATVISQLSADLEKERKRDVELTEAERETLRELTEKKALVDQFVSELSIFKQLDQSLDAALAASLEQIRAVAEYQQRALQNLEAITRTLSDVEAKQLFTDIKTQAKNIAASHQYLADDMPHFFIEANKQLKERMQRMTTALGSLKKQGVALSKKVEDELAADEKRRQQERAAQQKTSQEKSPTATGWLSWIWRKIAAVGEWFASFFRGKK